MLSTEILNKNVRRNNNYNDVVNLLVHGSIAGNDIISKVKVFSDIKDLIVFAAFVGEYFQIKEDVDVKNSTGITLMTFSGSGSGKRSRLDQHNIIFMMSLLSFEDMNMIRDENINDAIDLFEKFSNGGLSKIRGWLVDSAWNPIVLLDKIIDELPDNTFGQPPEDNPF